MRCRMSLSYSTLADVWLKEKSMETGATKAGVIRMLILKAMIKEETAQGRKVNPKRVTDG